MKTEYNPGDLVMVGLAYRGSGRYAPDGCEGLYTVLRALPPGDYYLARGAVPIDSAWDVICHVSRMTPAQGAA